MDKSPEQLYNERIQRVLDVVALRTPDQVPVFGPYQLFPFNYGGVTLGEAMNDYAAARRACHKFLDDFQPDLDFGPVLAYPAKPMAMMGMNYMKWPGNGLDDNVMYQFSEAEYMSADEYPEFIKDPSDFMMTKWMPRAFSAFTGFAKIPTMRRMMWSGWFGMGAFSDPELVESLRLAAESGAKVNEWWGSIFQYIGEIKEKGFPIAWAAFDWPPFDIIGDTLRGTREILGDIRRRPEALLDALEVSTRIFVEYGAGAAGADMPLCWIWVHKATRDFMSDAQFKKFYWPFLREGMMALIDKGVIPLVYWEADIESRLETIVDIPPGKVIYHLSATDVKKAYDVLGGTVCLMGNVPNSMLVAGTPDDVKDYCKMTIDVAGKDGGLIMDTAVMLDEAKPENLKAMFDFTREYGRYA
ncbi:MAG: hypothetical protein J5I90_13795 [Caldilineales bacterium]|nr:hypothetical protein [Caldilineales bacterium]